MNDYTPSTLSKASKVAARFIQRTRWVMNLQKEIAGVEKSLEYSKGSREAIQKGLACAAFDHEQAVKTGNPRIETFSKNLERVEKVTKEELECLDKKEERYSKTIEDLTNKIADVESGKLKVCADTMNETAKELVRSRVETAFNESEFDKAD